MAAVEQIVDLKDLPAGTPDPEDVLVYRDVSENTPETAYKKCTPAQAGFLQFDSKNQYIENTDLDTITKVGIFSVRSNDATNHHFPSGTNGLLIVLPVGETGKRYKQIFSRIGTIGTSDRVNFIRQMDDTTVGNWERISLYNEVFYSSEDTINSGTASNYYYLEVPTIVTNSTTSIRGTLILPKQYSGRKQVTCSKLSGFIRSCTGGYMEQSTEIDFANSNNYTVVSYLFDNKILFFINKTTGKWTLSDGTGIINNSAQIFEIRSYEFTV